jgi:hypothetical protein
MTGSPGTRSEARRRWAARISAAFAVWAAIVTVATLQGNRPDALLLGLTVAAFAATVWLYLDASVLTEAVVWADALEDPVREPGEDGRLAYLTRVVGQHLDAREVGDGLHQRLVELVDHRLMAGHGVSLRADPERAAGLLGPELAALVLQQPPHPRLDVRRIDVLLSRIEAL